MNSSREPLKKLAARVAAGDVVAIPSPCVSICRMNMDTDLCEGCLRTIDEIAAWGRMTEGDKREVWAVVARRIDEEKP